MVNKFSTWKIKDLHLLFVVLICRRSRRKSAQINEDLMQKTNLLCALIFVLASSAAHAQSKPNCVMLGYSAVWRDPVSPVTEYNFDSLTCLCRAFLKPMPDGSVGVPDGYFNPDLEKLSHEHGCKLLMSIGGGDASPADWLSATTHPANLQKFLDNLGKLMADHHYDGFDIDWEPPDPTKADGDAFGLLLKALKSKFPQAVSTTALDADAYQTRFIPWPDVLASVEYINVMCYDYSGPWGGVAGHSSNLHPAGDYTSIVGHSTEEGMDNLIKKDQLPPGKLLMGMSFYGDRFRANHIGGQFKANAANVADNLSYHQIQGLLATGHYRSLWDAKAEMPYLERTGGGSVICFENSESIRLKCEYAKELGCAGMMIWNMGADIDGVQTPLMDAAAQSSGSQRHLLTRAALEAQITDDAQMIQRDAQANPGSASAATPASAVPSSLAALSIDQLESLAAQLRTQAGAANDALWQSQATAVASH
jgi:chitinase